MIAIGGRCLQCEGAPSPYYQVLNSPTRANIKSQQANRQLWAETHYELTGHHRFEFMESTVTDVSVATIPNPDQLRISEDEDYGTMTVSSEQPGIGQ